VRREFPPRIEVGPEGQRGEVIVEHFTFTEEESQYTRLRAAFGHPHEFCKPGRYARLRFGRKIWMTDTSMERDACRDVLLNAHGEVLIAGLGLGMVIAGLIHVPEVKHITVVENHPDVIALVEPALQRWAGLSRADRFHIEQGDIFYWRPPRGVRYDTIYFDIWPDISRDNLPEVKKLRNKFRNRLTPRGLSWIGAWMEDL